MTDTEFESKSDMYILSVIGSTFMSPLFLGIAILSIVLLAPSITDIESELMAYILFVDGFTVNPERESPFNRSNFSPNPYKYVPSKTETEPSVPPTYIILVAGLTEMN